MATNQEESADLLYAMRAVMVLLGSGIGLESALQMIGRGGYGAISRDFKEVIKNLQRGSQLEQELAKLSRDASTKAYSRFLNTLRTNVTSDTDCYGLFNNNRSEKRKRETTNSRLTLRNSPDYQRFC